MAATRTGTGLFVALTISLALSAAACSSPPVGDPCIPDEIPEGGFSELEAFIEVSSAQCLTRLCMVYHYEGDPRDRAIEEREAPEDVARALAERDERVYCTCRCDADDPNADLCSCPSGYECAQVLDLGSEGVRGSYCVLEGTVRD